MIRYNTGYLEISFDQSDEEYIGMCKYFRAKNISHLLLKQKC